MGSGRWDTGTWATYSKSTVDAPTSKVYSARGLDPLLDPRAARVRESRDSADNQLSTPIAVALDVTGSMGVIADHLAREGLGTLFSELLSRRPVSDPHLMFMAVGDYEYDQVPFQVSQFEADARIIEQLTKIYLEHGGGGNSVESYHLPYYFAATHTSTDSFEKRKKKGYLFTLGDENPPAELTVAAARSIFGDTLQADISTRDLVRMAERMYHVFHVVVEQGDHVRHHGLDGVLSNWRELLGQRVILLSDYTKLAEVIVSTIQVTEGADRSSVADSWDKVTNKVVGRAIATLPTSVTEVREGVTRL